MNQREKSRIDLPDLGVAMSNYNYANFSSKHFDLLNFKGPKVGEKAPDGSVLKTDGTQASLLDFEAPFFVLETGSITCPLFQTRRRKMTDLVLEFPDVDFGILYIREAHPGTKISSHQSLENKRDCATRLASEDNEKRDILVDGTASHQPRFLFTRQSTPGSFDSKTRGKGATWDFLKSLPTLIWMNFIVHNIKVLLNKPSSADVNC